MFLHKLLIVLICINKYKEEKKQEIIELTSKILNQLQNTELLITTTNVQLNKAVESYLYKSR